jgi:hypothetical protein
MIPADNSSMDVNTAPLSSDSKKGYAGMPSKTGFLLIDNDRKLIRDHAHTVREALFACTTQPQVECSVAFARYLSYSGLNNDNYWLFLRLIMTNNPWVIDELLHERTPRLLFSTIRPEIELLDAAFEMLFSRHPEEMYTPALEAVLGIIQNAYFDPDDGFRIRRLTIMDINALGKFLVKSEPQDNLLNKLILEILDRIAQVGVYYGEQDKNVLSKHAFNVRYAYFDHTRNLIDAIPEPLLIRVSDRTGVEPEDDYADLVAKRRLRKRDIHGRFVKESVSSLPLQADRTVSPLSPGTAVLPEVRTEPAGTPKTPEAAPAVKPKPPAVKTGSGKATQESIKPAGSPKAPVKPALTATPGKAKAPAKPKKPETASGKKTEPPAKNAKKKK